MRNVPAAEFALGIVALIALMPGREARADFTLHFEHPDFVITNTYNRVLEFRLEISVAGDLVAGGIYNDPTLNSVSYRILGNLADDPTPSNFNSNFLLVRDIAGGDFYGLSSDASLSFSVLAGADLSDGLQIAELAGVDPVFNFNAREVDQNPGRYHPPIFTLNRSGTGRLTNANNMSTIPNPSNQQIVDVSIGAEYIADLNFNPNLTISAVPEPSSTIFIAGAIGGIAVRRMRKKRKSEASV